MSNPAEMIGRATQVTGLRSVAGGRERALALDSLNNAYKRVLMDTECAITSNTYTFVAAASSYTLTTVTAGATPMKIYHVAYNSGGGPLGLDQCSYQELLDHRAMEDTVGTPALYAMRDWRTICFYPNPAIGDTVTVQYVETPTDLADNTVPPSLVPVQFHWDVLFPAMVMDMMLKDQKIEEAKYWQEKYERGIARMQEWIGQFGGNANRMYIGPSTTGSIYNDMRTRR